MLECKVQALDQYLRAAIVVGGVEMKRIEFDIKSPRTNRRMA